MMLVRACLVAGSASAAIAGWEAARGVAEWRRLELVLLDLVPSGRISSRQDLGAIKNFLTERISCDVDRRHEKRPLLREPASVILETGYGFCGENARVAILLLALGGVRANRLYLTGSAWNHVAVEHRWDGHWFLFDGHADPCTVLPDEAVASIPSNSVQLFPNGHRPHNSWIDVHRIHFLHRFSTAHTGHLRLPRPLAIMHESPSFMRAAANCIAGGALIALSRRRRSSL